MQNINIADSIRDNLHRTTNGNGGGPRNGGTVVDRSVGGAGSGGGGGGGAVPRKSSVDAELTPDEIFAATSNRKKPNQLKDDLSNFDERESRRKERTKRLRGKCIEGRFSMGRSLYFKLISEKSRSKERARMGDMSKF